MKFAINYSPESEQLWRAGQIHVDVFKCPDWDDLVPRVQKMHGAYVHGGLFAGRNLLADVDFERLDHWLRTTETKMINMHLAPSAGDFPADVSLTPEVIIKQAVSDIEYLGERFGNDRVIVEHIPFPMPDWSPDLLAEAVDPTVIGEIVRRTGCGFLLDVAHAVRACEGTARADVKAFINALPLHALCELHIVGILPETDEYGVRVDHFPMTAADWQLAEWVVAQIRAGHWPEPETLAFEYGGVGPLFEWRSRADVIAEQAPRLYQLAKSV